MQLYPFPTFGVPMGFAKQKTAARPRLGISRCAGACGFFHDHGACPGRLKPDVSVFAGLRYWNAAFGTGVCATWCETAHALDCRGAGCPRRDVFLNGKSRYPDKNRLNAPTPTG